VKITFPPEVNTYVVTLSHYGEKVLVTPPSPAIPSSRFGPMERISFTNPPTTVPTVSYFALKNPDSADARSP
jgi:hypothetical protein